MVVAAAVIGGWFAWRWFRGGAGSGGIRNVVIVSIDTCRADRLNCYGYAPPTTPGIDAIAREGVLFESAITPVPLTTPAHSSMLTGLYPPAHGVRVNNGDRLADSSVTLAERFAAAGYRTGAFVSGFPLDSRFGLNQGFETYDCQLTKTSDKSVLIGERSAEETSRPALAWLEQHAARPFFLFVHYYDAHQPYEPPAPFASAHASDPYAGEIACIDSWIGRIVDRLRALGVYDETLLVVTGDHGESLGEHGETTHGVFVYQSTLHVPLILRGPGVRGAGRVAGNVSLVDVAPTVLDLAGLPPMVQTQGISLRAALASGRAPIRQESIYCESLTVAALECSPLNGLVEGNWKYIRAPRQELYDLARDPGEQHDVAGSEARVAGELRERLETMLRRMESAAPPRARSAVDADTLKRLASLGYLGGAAPASTAFDPTLEDPKDFQPTYERILQALDLFLSNRGAEARQPLLEVVRSRPRLITPLSILAQIAANARRFDEAAGYCARILAILTDPGHVPREPAQDAEDPIPGKLDTRDLATAHVNLAIMLSEGGKAAEGIAEFEQALRLRPDYAEGHFNIGVMLARTGKLPEAIGHYQQAVRLKPNHVAAHVNLGTALLQLGRSPEAIDQFEQALRIDPNLADAHYNLGLVLQQSGRLPEAIWHYEEVLRIRPDFARANPHLTEALAAARRGVGAAPK